MVVVVVVVFIECMPDVPSKVYLQMFAKKAKLLHLRPPGTSRIDQRDAGGLELWCFLFMGI